MNRQDILKLLELKAELQTTRLKELELIISVEE